MPVPPSASWTIRKIFSLRRMVQPWIGSIIGDGQDTFLWLDNWHPLGLLKYRFEGRMDDNLVRSLQSKVASIIRNGSWFWARMRNRVVNEIMSGIPSALVPNTAQRDSVMWTLNGEFSIKSARQGFRQSQPEVLWWKSVSRVFRGKKEDPDGAVQKIIADPRFCTSAWKNMRRSSANRSTCLSLNISCNILC